LTTSLNQDLFEGIHPYFLCINFNNTLNTFILNKSLCINFYLVTSKKNFVLLCGHIEKKHLEFTFTSIIGISLITIGLFARFEFNLDIQKEIE
tara:strand:- start:902 stop:1180 length:279 start_codon:yes stop_codon:yes gene_type:complete